MSANYVQIANVKKERQSKKLFFKTKLFFSRVDFAYGINHYEGACGILIYSLPTLQWFLISIFKK